MITCITRNIPGITTLQIFDPNGMLLDTVIGVFIVANVTRSHAGTYTCIVTSTLDNSTVNETSVVTVECKILLCFLQFYFKLKVIQIVCM